MHISLRPILLLCAAVLLVGCPIAAQTIQDGTIEGMVRDTTGAALPNSDVIVESTALVGGPKTAHTDERGVYRALALPPGTYVVTAKAAGFAPQTRSGLALAPGRSLTVDLTLAVGSVEQQIQVDAEPVAADTRSTSASIVLGRTLLENLPLDRDVTNLVNLAPGVKSLVALGGAAFANPLQIDGMSGNRPDVNVPVLHPNLYWIDEAQMVGAGADARYGGYTGMLMNLVTRSGTDKFDGMGQYQISPTRWQSNNRGNLPAAQRDQFKPVQILDRWDASGQLGGPIRRQRLWFFAGWERYRDNTRPASFSGLPRTPDEPSVNASEHNFTAKLTSAVTNGFRINGLMERVHRDTRNFNAGPNTTRDALGESDDHETLANVSGTWVLDSRTVLEARGGVNRVSDEIGPPPDRRDGPPGHFDALTGLQSVNASELVVTDTRVASGSVSLTRFAEGFIGREHRLMFGAEYEHTSARLEDSYPGGLLYYDYGGAPYLAFEFAGSSKRPRTSTATVYAQDAWHIAPRVTVTPGVRIAWDSGTVQDIGHVMSARTTSPRIGAAWDVTRTHHVIVRGHYGHYHEAFASSFFYFLDPRAAGPTIEDRVVAPGVLVPLATFTSKNLYEIDPEFRMPYVREVVASTEYLTGRQADVTVQWIHRDFIHTAAGTRPDAIWTPYQFQDPGPDGIVGNADDGGVLTAYALQNPNALRWVITNPPSAYHRYDALQVIGHVRARTVELQGSWEWSRTLANFANNYSSNVALNSAGPFPGGSFTNPTALVNGATRTMFDVPLDVKVLATWAIPWLTGVRVSGNYALHSGLLGGRVVFSRLPTGGLQLVQAEPPDRRFPTTNSLDLRVDKGVSLGGGVAAHVLIDISNIWNQGIAFAFLPFSGPNFGQPTGWSAPRSFRAGVRITY
jgi:hypothetical protein